MARMERTAGWLALAGLLLTLPWLLGLQELAYDGSRVQPTQATTFQGRWVTVATLAGRHGTLAVGDRSYADVQAVADANALDLVIWEVPLGANWGQVRFQIDADADTATVQGWAAAAGYDPGTGSDRDQRDDFTLGWSWALTGGTQTGPNTNVYVDTIVATETWPSPGTVTDAGTNRICRYDFDLRGVRYLAFLRTDSSASTTVRIDLRIY